MKVSYGLVFFIAITMATATFLLLTLSIKSIRNLVMSVVKKYRIGEGSTYATIFWISFSLIFAILIDAVWSYLSMKNILQIGTKGMMLDNFDMIKSGQHQDYIIMFKQYREYYMAERNFMLTASTLFIMFVFNRFFKGFRKLYDIEHANKQVKTN